MRELVTVKRISSCYCCPLHSKDIYWEWTFNCRHENGFVMRNRDKEYMIDGFPSDCPLPETIDKNPLDDSEN